MTRTTRLCSSVSGKCKRRSPPLVPTSAGGITANWLLPRRRDGGSLWSLLWHSSDVRFSAISTNGWDANICAEWSGNAAISYFLPVMLEQAGITNVNTQLMLSGVIAVISFIGALIGSSLVDKVGRRKMLYTTSALFVMWFAIVAGLSAKFAGSDNKAASNATVAMIYLFGFTYSVGFTPFQALYPVECLSFETRAKGMAVYNLYGFHLSHYSQVYRANSTTAG